MIVIIKVMNVSIIIRKQLKLSEERFRFMSRPNEKYNHMGFLKILSSSRRKKQYH